MPNAANALLQMEQGASLVPFAVMTDSGDHQIFTVAGNLYSGESGQEPDVRPNGVVTGRNMVSPAASGSDNVVDIAAFTAYSLGVLQSVTAATDESINRPTTNKLISSITMSSAGAIAVVAGTEGTDFVETRGVAGGPPEIPADSVELAQVRLDSATAAPITADEIFQVVGQHVERYDFPVFDVDNVGQGQSAEVSAQTNAHVKFGSVLPLIHASSAPKRVYIQYYGPIFADISDSVDFEAVETSHSVSSTQVYGRSVASTSESIGQGGFTALVNDGVNDALVQAKNKTKTFRFYPDKNKTANVITQGKLGINRSWPAADQISVDATISAEIASAEFIS